MPVWFFFAALCACAYALEGAWMKTLNKKGYGTTFLAWAAVTLCTPPIWILSLYDGKVLVTPEFYLPLGLAILLNSFAFICYVRAFAFGDLSMTFPLLALTPVWMLLSTEAITGEFPSHRALVGIALITGGCYGLGFEGTDMLSPFKKIWKSSGSRYALVTSILWSITSNLDKVAIQASSRFFYPALHASLLSCVLFVIAWRSDRKDFKKMMTPTGLRDIGLLAMIGSALVFGQFVALDKTQATYVIAVKRAGMVPGVFIGWWFFGESFGTRRFVLSLVVAAGLFLMI